MKTEQTFAVVVERKQYVTIFVKAKDNRIAEDIALRKATSMDWKGVSQEYRTVAINKSNIIIGGK